MGLFRDLLSDGVSPDCWMELAKNPELSTEKSRIFLIVRKEAKQITES